MYYCYGFCRSYCDNYCEYCDCIGYLILENNKTYKSYNCNMKHTYENTFYNNKYKSKFIKRKIINKRKENTKFKNKTKTNNAFEYQKNNQKILFNIENNY